MAKAATRRKPAAKAPAQAPTKRPTRIKPADKTKRPVAYSAAGFSVAGVETRIAAAEYKRMGRSGYPWDKKTKAAMVNACNGAKTVADVDAVIKELTPNA